MFRYIFYTVGCLIDFSVPPQDGGVFSIIINDADICTAVEDREKSSNLEKSACHHATRCWHTRTNGSLVVVVYGGGVWRDGTGHHAVGTW
jgi:hypothetical protein